MVGGMGTGWSGYTDNRNRCAKSDKKWWHFLLMGLGLFFMAYGIGAFITFIVGLVI